jgi:Icc-related predicted phosphoesterase
MRVAAVGDIHVGADRQSAERLRDGLRHLPERADVFLLAGDLSRCGDPTEAQVVADAVAETGVATVAVLGNHDLHAGLGDEFVKVLESAGVIVLEGRGVVLDVAGRSLGVAGVKGFGGGFAGACVSEFGEDETKAFAHHAVKAARRLQDGLADLDGAQSRIVLLHYAPVRDTLRGEPPEVYPFLGSYLLGEVVDVAGADIDLVVHGHAHRGTERGVTPGGVRVRNVAQPVIRSAYRVFELGPPASDTAAA